MKAQPAALAASAAACSLRLKRGWFVVVGVAGG